MNHETIPSTSFITLNHINKQWYKKKEIKEIVQFKNQIKRISFMNFNVFSLSLRLALNWSKVMSVLFQMAWYFHHDLMTQHRSDHIGSQIWHNTKSTMPKKQPCIWRPRVRSILFVARVDCFQLSREWRWRTQSILIYSIEIDM